MSVTWIKGCLHHHCGSPPEATEHLDQATNPRLMLGTLQLTNHSWHPWAVPHSAAAPSQLLAKTPRVRGLQQRAFACIIPNPNTSVQGPSNTKAGKGAGQSHTAGAVGDRGPGSSCKAWGRTAPVLLPTTLPRAGSCLHDGVGCQLRGPVLEHGTWLTASSC